MRTTTKDTKSMKMEFKEVSNRVIGCSIEDDRHLGRMASTATFSDSFVLFVSFVVK